MKLAIGGMIGGAGQALTNQSAFIGEQEKADAQMGREKNLQGWLMQQREQYAIQSETRAETRAVASEDRGEQRTIRTEKRTDTRGEEAKDRDFNRAVKEAPTRREIKSDDKTAELGAELDFNSANVDTIGKVAKSKANNAQSDADVDEKKARTGMYDANAEYTRTEKKSTGGRDPLALESLKSINDQIEKDEARLKDGLAQGLIKQTKDPATGKVTYSTPEHQELARQLGVLKQRRDDMAAQRSKAPGASASDPLGRAPAAGGTGMVNGGGSRQDILQQEYTKAHSQLAAAKTDDERQRAQNDITALDREAGRDRITLTKPGAAAPAAPVAPAATAADPLGRKAPVQLAPIVPAPKPAAAAPAADAGDTLADKAARLRERIAGSTAAPAAAAPGADPVAEALGADGSSAGQIVGQQLAPLRAAAAEFKAAQAQVVKAAQGGGNVAQAMQAVTTATAKVDALLKTMNPAQAAKVKQALGV